jgi:hypothetical protein
VRGAVAGGARGGPPWRAVVLLGILGVFLFLKLGFDPVPVGHHRADGTFYYQVARHVARGDGLRTSVSLYEQGLRGMPARTNVHPLWPLVLGGVGRLVGLQRAATLLPELLFFVDLLLLYILSCRVGRCLGAEVLLRIRGVPVLDVGHVAVLLLGSNAIFFAFTSLPWTEALAYCFLFAAPLALERTLRAGRAPVWAALAGALAGLAFLTRSQFLAAPLAVVAALALGGRRLFGLASLAAAAALAVVFPWALFVASLPGDFGARALVDFSAYRETPGLLPFSGFREFGSLAARLADMGGGLLYAFAPASRYGYVTSFGYAVYLVPAALALLAWQALAQRLDWRALASQRALLPVCVLLLWAGCLLPVHAQHAVFPFPWWFHWRHGLPMLLGMLVAFCWLWRGGLAPRALALALVASGLVASWRADDPLGAEPRAPGLFELEFFAWLDAHEQPPVVLGTQCREIALWSNALTHWTRCEEPSERTRAQLEHLPIDYVVLYPGEKRCRFVGGLERELELVRRFGSLDVYRPRRDEDEEPGDRRRPAGQPRR